MGHAVHNARRAVLIAGPTASGKSALALALAERLGGAIINADSMQVYRDLRIITARPDEVDEARAPHVLYGHVDAAVNYSVGRWCADVRSALADAAGAGRLPIVVGGTGLYFKALVEGLAAVPPTPAEVRARAQPPCTPNWHAAIR
jgi:tRNA dimethylallyltransferase